MKTVLGLGLPHVRGAISVFGCWFPVQGCGFKAIWPKLIKIKYSKMERSLNMRETKIEPHFAQILHFSHGFFFRQICQNFRRIWRFNPPVLEPRLSDGGASPQIRWARRFPPDPVWSPGKNTGIFRDPINTYRDMNLGVDRTWNWDISSGLHAFASPLGWVSTPIHTRCLVLFPMTDPWDDCII